MGMGWGREGGVGKRGGIKREGVGERMGGRIINIIVGLLSLFCCSC